VRTSSGTVVVDTGARIGRGAYVCPDSECLERGLSRGRLGHAFRKPSEAGPNLATAVWAAAGREAPVASALAFAVDTRAIHDVDVITVKA
jgi:predicted RNA-binding protein YlxR (DUF448 family)